MSFRIPFLNLTLGRLLVHFSLMCLVMAWILPTMGLLISSFRDKDQLALTGWWTAFTTSTQNAFGRTGVPGKSSNETKGTCYQVIFLKQVPKPTRVTTPISTSLMRIAQDIR